MQNKNFETLRTIFEQVKESFVVKEVYKCLQDSESTEEEEVGEEKCDIKSYKDALKYTLELKNKASC